MYRLITLSAYGACLRCHSAPSPRSAASGQASEDIDINRAYACPHPRQSLCQRPLKSRPTYAASSPTYQVTSRPGTVPGDSEGAGRARLLQRRSLMELWGDDSIDAMKRFQTDQNLDPDGKINSFSLTRLGLGAKARWNSAAAACRYRLLRLSIPVDGFTVPRTRSIAATESEEIAIDSSHARIASKNKEVAHDHRRAEGNQGSRDPCRLCAQHGHRAARAWSSGSRRDAGRFRQLHHGRRICGGGRDHPCHGERSLGTLGPDRQGERAAACPNSPSFVRA